MVYENLEEKLFYEKYEDRYNKKRNCFDRSQRVALEYLEGDLSWESKGLKVNSSKFQKFMFPKTYKEEPRVNIERMLESLIESPKLEKVRDRLLERLFESPKGSELINQKIEERLEVDTTSPFICDMSREISDEDAESEIKRFIKTAKENGTKEFNLLDVSLKTNLPFDQIDRILEKLRKRN